MIISSEVQGVNSRRHFLSKWRPLSSDRGHAAAELSLGDIRWRIYDVVWEVPWM